MTLPDIDNLNSFGGPLNNYAPVVDPTTDRDAGLANQAYSDVAMMTHTADRAWVRFTGSGTTPVVVAHDALWGSANANIPTLSRTATGVVLITWPASVQDELLVSHNINIRCGHGNSRSTTHLYGVAVIPQTANTVKAYLFKDGSTLDDAAGVDIDVFVK